MPSNSNCLYNTLIVKYVIELCHVKFPNIRLYNILIVKYVIEWWCQSANHTSLYNTLIVKYIIVLTSFSIFISEFI